jgi:hypothetical protein
MEPFWDNVMIDQVIGRGFRIKAHQYITDLKDRIITVYKYIAVTNSEDDASTDQKMVYIANHKDRFREIIKTLRIRASVDCLNNCEYNELAPDQRCFFFTNMKGPAYSLSIDNDAKEMDSRVVGKKELTGAIFVVNSIRYVTFEETVQLEIKSGDNIITKAATIAYNVPTEWKQGDKLDRTKLRLAGYNVLIGSHDGNTVRKFLDASLPNIKLMQGAHGRPRITRPQAKP